MLAQLGVYQITVAACDGLSLRNAQGKLATNPIVNYAELVAIVSPTQITGSPNDPYFLEDYQWDLTTINAKGAWSFIAETIPRVTGGATIGVIDSGINASQTDLHGEVTPGLDWCVKVDSNSNCLGVGTETMDDSGHGTAVAGVAAAITNNGIGLASPAYRANLIAEKVDPPNQPLNYPVDAIAYAITDAVFRGARVINLSLASSVESATLSLAISDAIEKGVVIIASAGNSNNDVPQYPAVYAGLPISSYLGQVIAVGATDQNDKRAVWDPDEPGSTYGYWVTLYAPGTKIPSTGLTGYVDGNGTSFAGSVS